MLANIRVVLVSTSHPGNIGAAARAMKTMGLTRLYLVDPARYPDAEATARSSGANDVLANAHVCSDVDEALQGCRFVVGASARSRSIPVPLINPGSCAQMLRIESETAEVALLFGCERSGLSNPEIDRCNYLVQIPANPDYSSLNLAAAVQIICYEIFIAHAGESALEALPEHLPVAADEMERFYRHREETLVALDFLDRSNPRMLMRRLRRLYTRARPDANEVNILRGILTAAGAGIKQDD